MPLNQTPLVVARFGESSAKSRANCFSVEVAVQGWNISEHPGIESCLQIISFGTLRYCHPQPRQ